MILYYLQIGTVLFLLILKPLIDFFCGIQLTNTSSTVLNSSGESGHLFLVSDLREKDSSL